MRTLPIKPEHQGELRYLLGDVFQLQRLNAPYHEVANAMRRLAKRHLELYPELKDKRISFSQDCTTMDVFDSSAEWLEAIKDQARREKESPYIAFAADPECKGYDILGPGKGSSDAK